MENIDRVKIAYKKLKSSVYFDKTQLPLRDKIVWFEDTRLNDKLKVLCSAIFNGENWEEYEQRAIDSVGVMAYPKKLESISSDTAIFNSDNIPIKMAAPQYFIDLSAEGHILSVLWILSIGVVLDKNSDENNSAGMYEHSYGNRLRKTLINPETEDYTYSPSLFEPYFAQYESWRDFGLEQAKKKLKDKQDAMILTLDFKSFYYSVDIREKDMNDILNTFELTEEFQRRLNDFVWKVIAKYSEILRSVVPESAELKLGKRNVLPIGFLPSNILSNWALTPFDNAVIEKWNPVYYGRYVDDVIIVDKVEKNSEIYRKARTKENAGRLTSADVIKTFLADKGILSEESKVADDGSKRTIFKVAPASERSDQNDIGVQDSKVKLFYFQSGATQALLTCFQTKITQNASEFRLMPNLDSILIDKNYSEIFDLKNEEGINKFRGVTGVELDKFAMSKFLGKYRKVSGMIDSKEENAFERDLLLILDERTLIANYSTWEKLFEILIINDRIDLLKKLTFRIIDALKRYEVPDTICTAKIKTHDALLRVLRAALCRTTALSWEPKVGGAVHEICERINSLRSYPQFSSAIIADFNEDTIKGVRKDYCETRMINKYVLPLTIDWILQALDGEDVPKVKLWALNDVILLLDNTWASKVSLQSVYHYYPYMVTPHELSFALSCISLKNGEQINPVEQEKQVKNLFIMCNYPLSDPDDRKIYSLEKVETRLIKRLNPGRDQAYVTHVECSDEDKLVNLRVAVGNAHIKSQDFFSALDWHPNRSYKRYRQFSEMFDTAVREKVELLVLPENYLPFEWLPVVARMCANNQMAMVTGIEHIVVPSQTGNSRGQVYNFTATILPYEHDGYPFVDISYHNKVAYSPDEQEQITGHGYTYKQGSSYQLFCWRDIWFPVYCCYELASIQDRALFQTYADLFVAVEWNKDVPYFSNIMESLSRDIHCYCIQANSSDYGDSRVVAPKETFAKDIIKTKGGQNCCILVDNIDIKALRDFQMLENTLQSKDHTFKQTPPRMDKNGVDKRRNGELFEWLTQEIRL